MSVAMAYQGYLERQQNPNSLGCRVQQTIGLMECRVQQTTGLTECRVQQTTGLIHCRVQQILWTDYTSIMLSMKRRANLSAVGVFLAA